MEPLYIVAFVVVVGERLTEALARPLFTRFNWDTFWLLYVAWLICSGLVALTQVNLFAAYIPDALAGLILTAIVAGGGSNFLHEIFNLIKALRKP